MSARAIAALALALAGCGAEPETAAWRRASSAGDAECVVHAGERLAMARKDGALFCLRYRPGPSVRDGETAVKMLAASRGE